MTTAAALAESLKKVSMKDIAIDLYDKHQREFTSAVRSQLWDGKKPDGSDITPSYLDDPFFKSKKQAEAYARWKSSGGYKNPKRNLYTPNLYINGYFYTTIALKVSEHPEITSGWAEVANKYKDALGVSKENKEGIRKDFIQPDMQAVITGITGLKFN